MEAHNGMHTMESTSTDCDQVGDCVDCINEFSFTGIEIFKAQVLIVAGGTHSELWFADADADTHALIATVDCRWVECTDWNVQALIAMVMADG